MSRKPGNRYGYLPSTLAAIGAALRGASSGFGGMSNSDAARGRKILLNSDNRIRRIQRAGGRVVSFARGGNRGVNRGVGLGSGRAKRVGKRTRTRGKSGGTRTKTKTKKKRARKVKKAAKAVRKLAKPRTFSQRLDDVNNYIQYDTSKFITADTIQARGNVLKSAGQTMYRTISGLGSCTYLVFPGTPASGTTAGTFKIGYGDSLYPYLLAAENSYTRATSTLSDPGNPGVTYAGAVPVFSQAQSIGAFGSRLQGAQRNVTAADQGRSTYLQIKSYSDTYQIDNICNVPCSVRVWHIRQKHQKTLMTGTMAGSTVAAAGAPTYLPGTGDFEDQLEAAAITDEYQDDSVYDALGVWPLPFVTNTAPLPATGAPSNFSSASGSRNLVYGAVWGTPMNKWTSLKKNFSIKCVKRFKLPVGGKKILRYNYKAKVMSLQNLLSQIIDSDTVSSTDLGEQEKRLKIMIEVIGDDAISNDEDMQVDKSPATIAVKNTRTIVHRTVTYIVPKGTFVTNSVWSTQTTGFNRRWENGIPAVAYAQCATLGPEIPERPGHIPVDAYMTNAAGTGWVPLKEGTTATALKTSA